MGSSEVWSFCTWIRKSVFRPHVVGHNSHWNTGLSPTEWIILWALREFDCVNRAWQMSPENQNSINSWNLDVCHTYIDKVFRPCEYEDAVWAWRCQVKRKCNADTDTDAHRCDIECAASICSARHLRNHIQGIYVASRGCVCSEYDAPALPTLWTLIRRTCTDAALFLYACWHDWLSWRWFWIPVRRLDICEGWRVKNS